MRVIRTRFYFFILRKDRESDDKQNGIQIGYDQQTYSELSGFWIGKGGSYLHT